LFSIGEGIEGYSKIVNCFTIFETRALGEKFCLCEHARAKF